VFERTLSGEEREWGTVTAWDPPHRIEFTWHPSTDRDQGQSVEIEFYVDAFGTSVTLTHRGWDHAGIQALAGCFSRFVASRLAMA